MELLEKYNSRKLILISLLCALFVMYPKITWIPWEMSWLQEGEGPSYILFFIFSYLFYSALLFALIKINLQKIDTLSFPKRFWPNFLICVVAYALYGLISLLVYPKLKHFGSLVLFQFFVMCILCSLMGYIFALFKEQRKKEKEIEQLKVENLNSRYVALTNQINPHFFFNSLNGLVSLIRKKDNAITLTYVNKLSDVFRYILQSDRKGLVTLREELEFVDAFRYMMEVRFANKLLYEIEVEKDVLNYKIPVLSILPLLDNIVVHNIIDSNHVMVVSIRMNEKTELVISNPIYPKLSRPVTNGTGIMNLESRYSLLMNKQIRVEHDDKEFRIYLPLL